MISFGKLRHNIEAYDTIFRLLNWNAVYVCAMGNWMKVTSNGFSVQMVSDQVISLNF